MSVNALLEVFHFIGVAGRAFGGREIGGRGYLVHVAVARLASFLAQGRVNTVRHARSFIFVASRTLDLGYFGGMRKVFDGGVAIGARQNAMDAGRVFRGIDGDDLAGIRFHSWLAVTGQAVIVLFDRLRFRLGCKRTS